MTTDRLYYMFGKNGAGNMKEDMDMKFPQLLQLTWCQTYGVLWKTELELSKTRSIKNGVYFVSRDNTGHNNS